MNFGFLKRRLRSLSWPRRGSRTAKRLGDRGERVAARHLKRKRFRIIARNYRCPLGEIDLICRDGEAIVFVEVKTRSESKCRDLADVVGPRQWQRIARAAKFFLRERIAEDHPWRLDLVMVEWPPSGRAHVEHIEDAHQPRS